MVEFLLFVLTIGLFAYIRQLSSKLGALEAELDDIRLTFRGPEQSSSPYPAADHQNMPLAAHEAADASPLESVSLHESSAAEDGVQVSDDNAQEPLLEEMHPFISDDETSFGARFEQLVGGRLPIWVGAAALVFAAIFLVRYSIELGFFGPRIRSITAALFGLTMIGLAVGGPRLPRIGAIFASDKRIGQALAGGGIATLYATLYMAAELYGLLGLSESFILVVAVTILAFALALRYGPPTAIFGLIGGFAAPWIADLGPDSLPLLSLYLAILITGLFGMATHMRWLWLVLGAVGAGLLWMAAMIVWDANAGPGLIGLLIFGIGCGGALAANWIIASDGSSRPVSTPSRLAGPIIIGSALLELGLLVSAISFQPLGWLFYGTLSLAVIILARRDSIFTPAVIGALALALIVLASAIGQTDVGNPVTISAAIGITLIFGIGGFAHSVGREDSPAWAIIGLAAPAMTMIIYDCYAFSLIGDVMMGALAFVALLPAILLAWFAHRVLLREAPLEGAGFALTWASGVSLIMVAFVVGHWAPIGWSITVWVAALLPFFLWHQHAGGKPNERGAPHSETSIGVPRTWRNRGGQNVGLGLVALLALSATGLSFIVLLFPFHVAALTSLLGVTDHYARLPALVDGLKHIALPAMIFAGLALRFGAGLERPNRWLLITLAAITGSAAFYLIAKQPLAIETPADFTRFGFIERAIITQMLAGACWICLARGITTSGSSWTRAGWILGGIAVMRFTWFDLFLLNPVATPQHLGPTPFANAGTIHLALSAMWLWLFLRNAPSLPMAARLMSAVRLAMLAIIVLAVLITVRQIMHGSVISGHSVGETETYLYSATLLGLSIVWLWRGLSSSGDMLIRLAGLTLLTIVTVKVFLIDAAAVQGILRILSFMALGVALIGIGWFFGKLRNASS